MNRAGKKKRRSWKYLPERGVGLLLSFSVPLFILLLFSLNPEFIHNLELKMFDQRFKWRGARDPGDQVIIVAIDEKSIERFGRWPWPRSVIAELIDRLAQAHAKVIAFDIVFSEPDSNTALRRIREVKETFQQLGLAEQGDAGTQVYQRLLQMEQETDNDTRLITAVQQAGNVVLGIVFYLTEKEIAHFSETQKQDQEQRLAGTEISVVRGSSEHAFDLLLTAQGVLPNIPGLSRTAYAKGYLNQDPDVDGVIRRTPLIIKFRNSLYPSLDLQILRASLDGALIQLKAKEFGIESFQVGNLRIPTTETGKLFIDYAGPESTFPTYSFSDVLQGVISPEIFQDKIVLIGPTALGISDIRITPFSTVFPGVEIHANVLENILNKRFIMRGNWLLLIDAVLIATLGIVLGSVILRLSPLSGAFITLICLGGYVSLNSFLLVQEGIWLHLVYPTMSIVLTYVSITVYKYFTEEKEKRFIKGAFSQYLAPSVINQLLADPRKLQLGGERRVCTAFFSDLAGFSTILAP